MFSLFVKRENIIKVNHQTHNNSDKNDVGIVRELKMLKAVYQLEEGGKM